MVQGLFFILPAASAHPGSGPARQAIEKRFDTAAVFSFGNFGAGAAGDMKYENNGLLLSTQHTRHCFFESDAYSFAYRQQAFPYDDCSKSTVAVKIDRFSTGAAGIMMRSDLRLGAANVHLEASATGDIILFSRKTHGAFTSYTHLVNLSFPMELKLVRQGASFTGYYKDKTGQWIKGGSVMVEAGPAFLAGFYACSGEAPSPADTAQAGRYAQVSFHDWHFQYEENYIPAETRFTDTMPVAQGTMLRDNFNDGSLSNLPESVVNPVWKGIRYGLLPYSKDGGRYWRKTGDGIFYFGDKKWADYQVSIDLGFDTATKAPNEFVMQLRYQDISIYTPMARYYSVVLRNGNKLLFEKYDPAGLSGFSKSVTLPGYFDGSMHTIKVRLLDRNYEVYYDNKRIIEGTDTLQPITWGNISLKFTDALMNIDNLEVTRINDPVNGDADNYLQDYFDTPIPAYIKKYGYK